MRARSSLKVKESAALFSALGDETRLELVAALGKQGPQSISQLAAGKKISRQAVTKHLATLRAAGIAHCRQDGREKIWNLDQWRLQIAQGYLELMSKRWDHVLGRLKHIVED